jgi:hypothetical protein
VQGRGDKADNKSNRTIEDLLTTFAASVFELTASDIEAPYSFWKKKGKIMSKNMDTKKDGKKKPAKSLKEKRAEKKTKKDTKK